MNWFIRVLSVTLLIVVLMGCSHQFELTNEDAYYSSATFVDKPTTLGISPTATQTEEIFVSAIVNEIIGSNNTKVIFPYVESPEQPVDYVVTIDVSAKYSGSMMNWLISWPGFYIFTPAWNGFIYYLDVNTNVMIKNYNTGKVIVVKSYDTRYKAKHAELDRTFIEISWLEYGVIAFIGGFLNTMYDKDITPDFNRAVSGPYGRYIGRTVIKSIMNL